MYGTTLANSEIASSWILREQEGTKLGITLEQLQRNISAAWDSETYPPEVAEALRSETSYDETREARAKFIGKTWRDVSEDVLMTMCPSSFVIGHVPFAYYLPAFLLAATRNPDSDLLDNLIEFKLIPPRKEAKLSEFENRFASLTKEQRLAVAQFLGFASANFYSDDARFKRRVSYALLSYWERPEI